LLVRFLLLRAFPTDPLVSSAFLSPMPFSCWCFHDWRYDSPAWARSRLPVQFVDMEQRPCSTPLSPRCSLTWACAPKGESSFITFRYARSSVPFSSHLFRTPKTYVNACSFLILPTFPPPRVGLCREAQCLDSFIFCLIPLSHSRSSRGGDDCAFLVVSPCFFRTHGTVPDRPLEISRMAR